MLCRSGERYRAIMALLYNFSVVNVLKFCTPKFMTKWDMQTADPGSNCLPFHRVFFLKKQLQKQNFSQIIWN